ncbi:MAG: hypothetical protein LBM23_02975 [Propionibacteriaceae bacterium]|nr:hypothetical protein [Propionibacteriaceae bacterium]
MAAGVVGGLMMLGIASTAGADEVESDAVDVTVSISSLEPVGALTMTVAENATTLTEVTAAEGQRQFDGVLPTVTVTDDRPAAPEGVFWYVVGQSSAFTSAEGAEIPAANFGWTPHLLTPAPDGEVAEGPQVGTVLDPAPDNVGLVGEELLSLALDSASARPTGSWDANADLVLKTPADVAPGDYSATITLTLWEDTY